MNMGQFQTRYSPLSAAFSKADLSRLTPISIPELVPALPDVVLETEQYETTPEFGYVWRMLRTYFPSLRKIHLEPFYSCKLYGINRVPSTPLRLTVGDLNFDHYHADRHCHSCFCLQLALKRRFRRLGIFNPWINSRRHDLDRMLDYHSIMEPVFKEEKFVIGTVPDEKGGKGEDVTVTFQVIYDRYEWSDILDLKQRRIDCDSVKRQCVVKTLQHALGPPTLEYEYMIYKI
ncbi:hypothetical protein F5Y06DRAFT_268960 [Hypoxylon sp. FL0890]|nr:hypothetical protein F5Y06DRAFT_268960 [Hypoxylon sp. FL0890]